ncbi:MAG: hypothetical protein WDN23_14115 [Edaphobacter sp.]
MVLSSRFLIAAAVITGSVAASAKAQTNAAQASGIQVRTIAGIASASIVDGFVREVVTQHASGAPQGMHLLLSGPKTIDVSVGPWLSPEIKKHIIVGATVHVVGLNQTINGKEYLFAQQVTINGQTFTVRNANGIPARSLVVRTGGAR